MKRLVNYLFVLLMLSGINVISASADNLVLDGNQAILDWVAVGGAKVTVDNLTIKGADVTNTTFQSIPNRLAAINGTLTLEGLTNGASFDDGVAVNDITSILSLIPNTAGEIPGGLVFRNCPYIDVAPSRAGGEEVKNCAMANITKINGDFILEYCPRFIVPGAATSGDKIDWNLAEISFGRIKEVTGDYILKGISQPMGLSSMIYLKKVGGNFELSNFANRSYWDFGFSDLEHVGGSIAILGGPDVRNGIFEFSDGYDFQLWSLECFKSLKFVGGDVEVRGCQTRLRPGGSGDSYAGYGFCWIRYLIDEGIIDYAHNNVILSNYYATKRGGNLNEELLIDLETLGGCNDGITPDEYPADLPKKTVSIDSPNEDIKFAEVYASAGILNIASSVNIEKVEVIDVTGKVLISFGGLSAGTATISISNLPSGVYIVKLISGEKTQVAKIAQ